MSGPVTNVVLVHGGFVDGSGWRQVHDLLAADGFHVAVVQNPTLSLADDVAVTRRAIETFDGQVVLVGHSYGGAVISEAGVHEQVAALVYIAAFAPDAGESVNRLIADPPPGAPWPPMLPPVDGFLFLDPEKFHAAFAADLPEAQARFMANSQVAWGVDALGGTVTLCAWREKPSWYLVATDDHMIPPPAQRAMADRAGATVSEVAASHSLYLSQAQATVDVVKQASQTQADDPAGAHAPASAANRTVQSGSGVSGHATGFVRADDPRAPSPRHPSPSSNPSNSTKRIHHD